MSKPRTYRAEWDLEHCWSEPGPKGMRLKNRETFAPARYVRKWKEGNEEMMLHSLEKFKTLSLRVCFEIEEHIDHVARRTGKIPKAPNKKKRWTRLIGKTLFVKKIPNQGMLWQVVKAMQDAAVEAAKR